MLSVLIGVLIICIVGAICFWAIDRFVNEARLGNLPPPAPFAAALAATTR